MKGSGFNTSNPKAGTSKGGGSKMQKTAKRNGDQRMPTPQPHKYLGHAGDGGAKNGKIKGC